MCICCRICLICTLYKICIIISALDGPLSRTVVQRLVVGDTIKKTNNTQFGDPYVTIIVLSRPDFTDRLQCV